jgi:hypothetical protein
MGLFEEQETNTEIIIEKLVPDENGNLRATLFIPVDNRVAYKLFYETFFERMVRDAHVRFLKAPEKKVGGL